MHLHMQLGKFRCALQIWPRTASLAILFLQGCLPFTSLTLLFLHLSLRSFTSFSCHLYDFYSSFEQSVIQLLFQLPKSFFCLLRTLKSFLAITDIVFLSFTCFLQLVCDILLCFSFFHTLSPAHLEIV